MIRDAPYLHPKGNLSLRRNSGWWRRRRLQHLSNCPPSHPALPGCCGLSSITGTAVCGLTRLHLSENFLNLRLLNRVTREVLDPNPAAYRPRTPYSGEMQPCFLIQPSPNEQIQYALDCPQKVLKTGAAKPSSGYPLSKCRRSCRRLMPLLGTGSTAGTVGTLPPRLKGVTTHTEQACLSYKGRS